MQPSETRNPIEPARLSFKTIQKGTDEVPTGETLVRALSMLQLWIIISQQRNKYQLGKAAGGAQPVQKVPLKGVSRIPEKLKSHLMSC
jgi:hypothetical protein